MLTTPLTGKDLIWKWVHFSEHLKVMLHDGTVVYSSITGYVSPDLTENQVKMIHEYYQEARMSYVF